MINNNNSNMVKMQQPTMTVGSGGSGVSSGGGGNSVNDGKTIGGNQNNNNNNNNWSKIQALKQRKIELEKLLNEKNIILQQIQKQEAQIIGDDFDLNNDIDGLSNGGGNGSCGSSVGGTDCSTNTLLSKRKIGTSFKNQKKISNTNPSTNNKEQQQNDLENLLLEKKLQQEICNAAYKLAYDINVSKSVRRIHKNEYEIAQNKLLNINHNLSLIKKQQRQLINYNQSPTQYRTSTLGKSSLSSSSDNTNDITLINLIKQDDKQCINNRNSSTSNLINNNDNNNNINNNNNNNNTSKCERRNSIKSMTQQQTTTHHIINNTNNDINTYYNNNYYDYDINNSLITKSTTPQTNYCIRQFDRTLKNHRSDYDITRLIKQQIIPFTTNDFSNNLNNINNNNNNSNHIKPNTSINNYSCNNYLLTSNNDYYDQQQQQQQPNEQQNDYLTLKKSSHQQQQQPHGLGGYWKLLPNNEKIWCIYDNNNQKLSPILNSTMSINSISQQQQPMHKMSPLSQQQDEQIDDKISISSMNSDTIMNNKMKQQKEKQWLETSLDGPTIIKKISQQNDIMISPTTLQQSRKFHNNNAYQQQNSINNNNNSSSNSNLSNNYRCPIKLQSSQSMLSNSNRQSIITPKTITSPTMITSQQQQHNQLISNNNINSKQIYSTTTPTPSLMMMIPNNEQQYYHKQYSTLNQHQLQQQQQHQHSSHLYHSRSFNERSPIQVTNDLLQNSISIMKPSSYVGDILISSSPTIKTAPNRIVTPTATITATPLQSDIRIESPKNMTIIQQAVFMPYKEITKPFEMSDFYKYSTKFRQKDNK